MKRYFGHDFRRISHACNVARYSEQIVKNEKGDLAVVLIAAYLHDIGIKEAERRYQSSAAKYQEELGPPVVREILESLGADPKLIEEVCDIVGHHHSPRSPETANFKALYDADMLVNLEESHKEKPFDREKLTGIIEKSFFTETGKKLVYDVMVNRF
jgi:HD superfamily phosphodiesterase